MTFSSVQMNGIIMTLRGMSMDVKLGREEAPIGLKGYVDIHLYTQVRLTHLKQCQCNIGHMVVLMRRYSAMYNVTFSQYNWCRYNRVSV